MPIEPPDPGKPFLSPALLNDLRNSTFVDGSIYSGGVPHSLEIAHGQLTLAPKRASAFPITPEVFALLKTLAIRNDGVALPGDGPSIQVQLLPGGSLLTAPREGALVIVVAVSPSPSDTPNLPTP